MDKFQTANQILREYEKNRHFAELKKQADTEKALSYPEFKELSDKYNALIVKFASSPDAEADDLSAKLSAVRKKQTALLKKLGIDNFYAEAYSCPHCKDTGYSGGKICDCVNKKIVDKLKEQNKQNIMPASFDGCDLALFDEGVRNQIANVYSLMKKYAENFPPKKYRNIFITGATGTGKTFLASCILGAVSEKGFYTEYLTAFNLNNLFLKCHISPLDEKYAILGGLIAADLLMIDDLGTEPILNNVTKEYLFNIINERTVAQKSTVISTNLSPAEILTRYGERIFSRICDKSASLLISLPGKDLRLK
ncbi:MAG: ATP-binding protein [Clostridiales bacterium]|jgi:DNA replication protein DnaC|nr:ATP-binding protein [Clostridiales bacterium]